VRFSWPASPEQTLPAAAAALALLLVAHAAAAAPASLTLPAAPTFVRADGNVVAAVVPGNRKGRCAQIVLWRVGGKPVTIETIDQCSNDGIGLDAVVDLALAGPRVAFHETNGGNNLEMIVSTATLARPKAKMVSYVENGGGAAGDPAGPYNGDLVGHGSLLTYATWSVCDQAGGGYARTCKPGVAVVYDQVLHRIGGGVLRRGADVLHAVWTDGSTIAVQHADNSLLLIDSRGRTLRTFPPVKGLVGAAVQGSQLVTLATTALTVWNARTGARVHTFPLAPAARVLEDLDGGVAVLGSYGTTHLIRLSDGRGLTFTHAAKAQLEPAGLYFADGRTLRFVPRPRIRFG
jgi:hypothetical protein